MPDVRERRKTYTEAELAELEARPTMAIYEQMLPMTRTEDCARIVEEHQRLLTELEEDAKNGRSG